jgi:ABC-type glycerol-3-phosphate transport system permease component
MGEEASWLTPLLLLPGVAILIASTATRSSEVHAEIHRLLQETSDAAKTCAQHELQRSRYFRNALFSLYVSVGLFTLTCLIGGILHTWLQVSTIVEVILTILGVLSALYAALQLAREALVSSDTIQAHVEELTKQES